MSHNLTDNKPKEQKEKEQQYTLAERWELVSNMKKRLMAEALKISCAFLFGWSCYNANLANILPDVLGTVLVAVICIKAYEWSMSEKIARTVK